MHFAQRTQECELMDTSPLEPADMRSTLRFLAWTNRYLGGQQTIFHHLKRWSCRWPKGTELTLLDVGAGGADIAVSIARWARRNGFDIRITAIDSTHAAVRIAEENTKRYPEIKVLETDFFSYAQTGGAFDYILCALFLHHMPEERLLGVLRACDALARRGILISDLRRSVPAFWGVKILTSLFGNAVVQHDGPLSILKSFHARELRELAERAGLDYLSVRSHPFFRLSLAGEKNIFDG